MRRCKNRVSLCLLLMVIFCSFWPFKENKGVVAIRVNTTKSTNSGSPLYVYVKEVDKGQFLKDKYHDVVKEAFDGNPNHTPRPIFPGRNYDLRIKQKEEEKPLAIYVLFTKPGADWKMFTDGRQKITLSLGESEITQFSVK